MTDRADPAVPAALEVTRSEEQLRVSTRRVPVRRARLERVQITEMVTVEVPVIREDVRIVYDTIEQDAPDAAVRAERPGPPRPWVLRGERIVISKEWVPLETVALTVDIVTGQEQVTDEVRKERVAVEGPPPAGAAPAADRPATANRSAAPASTA